MSQQVRRHGQDHHHQHYNYYQPLPLPPHPPPSAPLPAPPPLSSPAASRPVPASATIPSSPSSSANLIPRDYLGPRPDQQLPHSLRSGAPAAAAPRKPSPSPLQTSVQVESPRRYESSSSHSPLSSRSSASASPFQNRSPVGGNIANAAFPAPPTSNSGPNLSNQPETADNKSSGGPQHHDRKDMTDDKVNPTKSHTISDTTDSVQSATSSPSPISTISSLHSMAGERPGHRVMPRTSSIDSAISSLSSASQSHRSTFNANAVSQDDIGNLVSAAGSPEAVIIHLLKEKHHAASQNSQLWRLVDKQRALILGLNKDLERALKENEKRKKKSKDSDQRSQSRSLDDDNTTTGSQASSRLGHHAPNQSLPASNAEDYGQRGVSPGNVPDMTDTEGKLHGSQNSHQPLLRQEFSRGSPNSFAGSNFTTPAANETSSSSQNKPDRVPQPMRKPPPAPLKLGQAGPTIIEQPESDSSESEYEDIVPAAQDHPSSTDRGRKKTREEDDRDREATLIKEGPRSVSEGKHPQAAFTLPTPNPPPMRTGLPASPRPGASQFPPLDRPSESLASVLGPRMGHTGSLKEKSLLSSAPKSPGLPLSPRPEDRPFGSPMPRMPKDVPGALTPVSIPSDSGSGNLSGLALSPRATTNPNNPFTSREPLESNAAMNVGPQPIPSIDAAVKIDSPMSPDLENDGIYRGFVSDNYPDLLLPPNALPLVEVKVSSSRLRPSRNSYMALRPTDEEPVFTLGVISRANNKELWRVEKVIAALPQLDQQIRPLCSFAGTLPDRSIFSGHSPAKIDARRVALTTYFDTLLDTPMNETAALVVCQFLTSDAIEARDDETSLLKNNNHMKSDIMRGPDGKPRKEGYLTKRGKNFGGWKARYFVLHGPELRYFEAPGGAHMGTIKIPNSQIGKQSQNTTAQSTSPSDEDTDNQYRHAFLILEPKKKDSTALVRHVLCAESDEDRDAWVDALLEYVEGATAENDSSSTSSAPKNPPQTPTRMASNNTTTSKPKVLTKKNGKSSNDGPDSDGSDTVQGFSFDDAVPAEPPILGSSIEKPPLKSPSFPASPWGFPEVGPATNTTSEQGPLSPHPSKLISGPTNGAVIQDAGAWGNKANNKLAIATANKEKKRSIWGFRARSSMDLASQLQQADRESPTGQTQMQHVNGPSDRRELIRPVFGIPLAEAVQYCPPQGVDVELPAVVYRCIEYLQAQGASSEEGIFRLSGSNVVVKSLKERFNTEGDVDFLAGDQYYDVHAVASLFKQYLRELPSTVLTRELHLEFLRVLELDDRQAKIVAFNYLVHQLPKPNLTLLRALSQFLIEIVDNSDVNKMTVRNVGIVFAPTLNIPAPVFSMFLTDFENIFNELPGSNNNIKTTELTVERPRTATGGRSPRRQVFSDMPATASYGQTTFQQFGDPRMQYDTGFSPAQSNFPSDYNYPPMNPGPNQKLNPSLGDSRSSKAKRRESSMVFVEQNYQNPPPMPTSSREEPLRTHREISPS